MPHQVRNPCILTIEDDATLRASIVAWLEDEGYETLEAENGMRALEQIDKRMPDLILLDLGIPGITGEDLLAMLTERLPSVPVVIVSGRARIGDAIAAFKLGAWDYITKPIADLDMLGVIITNCLERSQLRALLASAESRYKQLVQHLPVMVFALDETLGLTFLNEAATPLLGWQPNEALSSPGWFMAGIHPDDREEVQAAFTDALTVPAASHGLEFRFMHRNGYPVPLQARFTCDPVDKPDSGLPGRIEGVLVDLTERIFVEKLLTQHDKLNTLAALSDEIAHEFRNPVFALAGFARALKRRYPETPEVDIIISEAERLEKLVGGIRDVLMPVAVPARPCSLHDLTGFCVDMMRPLANRGSVDLRFHGLAGLADVQTDAELLTQVLLGILTVCMNYARTGNSLHVALEDGNSAQRIFIQLEQSTKEAQDAQRTSSDECSRPLAVSHRIAKELGCTLNVQHKGGILNFELVVPLTMPGQSLATI